MTLYSDHEDSKNTKTHEEETFCTFVVRVSTSGRRLFAVT